MCRPWPSSFALLSLCLIIIQQVSACVDVLFVIDNKTLEVSRNRALQVARQIPEDQKIRKWVVLSRNDRYVPRVLRNNAELQSVLSTIHGDYDRFLEIVTGEIARRTATFQPFVILLFSETPVNQTMTNMWRSISLAPALHIYRIGSFQRTSKMLSEDQETDFEKLILCGRNKTDLFNTESSKFSGGNEIRRSPTSTPRPWTSTRDPVVRRLTFYDASQTLLDGKKIQELRKPHAETKYTITRTFKKMTTPITSTKTFTTTTTRPRTSYSNTRSFTKFDSKKHLQNFQTSKRKPFKWFKSTKTPKYTRTSYNKPTPRKETGVIIGRTSSRKPFSTTPQKEARWNTPRRPFHNLKTFTKKPITTSKTQALPFSSGYQMFPTTTRSSYWLISITSTMKPQMVARQNHFNTKTTRPRYQPYAPTTTIAPWWAHSRNTIASNWNSQIKQSSRPSMVTTTARTPYRVSTVVATTRKPQYFQKTRIRTLLVSTTTTKPFIWTTRRRSPTVYTITRRPQYTTSRPTTTRQPWWKTQTPRTLFRSSIWPELHTTLSPAPVSTIDSPPKKTEMEEIEQLNGKNFKVRSRSVHFAMTEKPPLTTVMNPMKFFSTTRIPITTARSLIPYSCTADVFFLVDLSQGTGDKSQQYLDIAASAISSLPISQETVRVGLISYSGPGRTHVRVYLDKHNEKEKLIEEMFLMERHGGTTRTADAIRYATKIFEGMAHPARKNVKKVLVVFTDGYSQDSPRDAARVARAKGIQLIAVAVKDRLAPPDEQQLTEIGGTSRNVFISPNGRELREKIIGTQCRM